MNVSSLVLILAASSLVTISALIADRSMSWVELPRRWTWLAAMLASVFIPYTGPWLPSLGLGSTARRAIGAVDPIDAAAALSIGSGPISMGPLWMLVAGWITLSCFTLAIVLGSYRRVLRKVSEGASAVIDGQAVVLCPDVGPFVLGLIDPKLVVPHSILGVPQAERRLIFEHELQHVRSRDGLALAFGSLLLVAMPWNPFLWLQHARLRLAIEIDCDRRVLREGVSRSSYGQALLWAAGGMRGQSWFVPAWGEPSSHLRERILSMTRPAVPYEKFIAVPGALVAALFLMAACEAGSPDSASDFAAAPQVQAGRQQTPSDSGASTDEEREIPIIGQVASTPVRTGPPLSEAAVRESELAEAVDRQRNPTISGSRIVTHISPPTAPGELRRTVEQLLEAAISADKSSLDADVAGVRPVPSEAELRLTVDRLRGTTIPADESSVDGDVVRVRPAPPTPPVPR